MKCSLLSRVSAALAKSVVALCIPLLLCSAQAIANKPELPNFDKRLDKIANAPKTAANPQKKTSLDAIAAKVKEAKIKTDEILGEPAYIGSTREFLTGKNGKGKAVTD